VSILVVEDDAFSRKLLVSILEKSDFAVEAKESAAEALRFLESGESCELIVSDVMMPRMDGFSLVQRLKADKRLQKIPIILCTSLGDEASIVKGIEAGIAGYVVKPVNEAILIPKINEVLEKQPGAVLVVDDEEVIRNLLVLTIQREGYQVLSAESGEQALELLKKTKIGLVISDIIMPEMDGFDLLVRIKELDLNTRVILMSDRTEHTRDQIISTGADGFIRRPFHNTEIVTLVRALYK